ncbi:hypothetical protein HRG_012778 [Hirsutella rhossiliensis]
MLDGLREGWLQRIATDTCIDGLSDNLPLALARPCKKRWVRPTGCQSAAPSHLRGLIRTDDSAIFSIQFDETGLWFRQRGLDFVDNSLGAHRGDSFTKTPDKGEPDNGRSFGGSVFHSAKVGQGLRAIALRIQEVEQSYNASAVYADVNPSVGINIRTDIYHRPVLAPFSTLLRDVFTLQSKVWMDTQWSAKHGVGNHHQDSARAVFAQSRWGARPWFGSPQPNDTSGPARPTRCRTAAARLHWQDNMIDYQSCSRTCLPAEPLDKLQPGEAHDACVPQRDRLGLGLGSPEKSRRGPSTASRGRGTKYERLQRRGPAVSYRFAEWAPIGSRTRYRQMAWLTASEDERRSATQRYRLKHVSGKAKKKEKERTCEDENLDGHRGRGRHRRSVSLAWRELRCTGGPIGQDLGRVEQEFRHMYPYKRLLLPMPDSTTSQDFNPLLTTSLLAPFSPPFRSELLQAVTAMRLGDDQAKPVLTSGPELTMLGLCAGALTADIWPPGSCRDAKMDRLPRHQVVMIRPFALGQQGLWGGSLFAASTRASAGHMAAPHARHGGGNPPQIGFWEIYSCSTRARHRAQVVGVGPFVEVFDGGEAHMHLLLSYWGWGWGWGSGVTARPKRRRQTEMRTGRRGRPGWQGPSSTQAEAARWRWEMVDSPPRFGLVPGVADGTLGPASSSPLSVHFFFEKRSHARGTGGESSFGPLAGWKRRRIQPPATPPWRSPGKQDRTRYTVPAALQSPSMYENEQRELLENTASMSAIFPFLSRLGGRGVHTPRLEPQYSMRFLLVESAGPPEHEKEHPKSGPKSIEVRGAAEGIRPLFAIDFCPDFAMLRPKDVLVRTAYRANKQTDESWTLSIHGSACTDCAWYPQHLPVFDRYPTLFRTASLSRLPWRATNLSCPVGIALDRTGKLGDTDKAGSALCLQSTSQRQSGQFRYCSTSTRYVLKSPTAPSLLLPPHMVTYWLQTAWQLLRDTAPCPEHVPPVRLANGILSGPALSTPSINGRPSDGGLLPIFIIMPADKGTHRPPGRKHPWSLVPPSCPGYITAVIYI